jgi:hypothetical protein
LDFDTEITNALWTFSDQTLSDIGASDFSNTLAWTAGGTGDTISYTTVPVPEPSSTALIAVGFLALAVRRHR